MPAVALNSRLLAGNQKAQASGITDVVPERGAADMRIIERVDQPRRCLLEGTVSLGGDTDGEVPDVVGVHVGELPWLSARMPLSIRKPSRPSGTAAWTKEVNRVVMSLLVRKAASVHGCWLGRSR